MSRKESVKTKLVVAAAAAVVIATMGVLAGCGGESGSADAAGASKGTDELITIRTWSRTDCSSTPWVVADVKGFFAAEGLKIEYTGDTQSAQQIPSILSGDNDFGGGTHPNTLAAAIAGGAELVAVAPGDIEPKDDVDPKFRHMWWFVNPESGITSIEDLKDYKPGQKLKFSTISTNICADFLANLTLDKYGIPRDRVEWISMPDVQAIQALSQGLVDVAGVHPPFYKGMEDSGAIKIFDSSEPNLGDAAGLAFYFTSKDFAEKNPDTVERFVRAIVKAQTWAIENYEEAAKLTEEAIGQPVTGYHYHADTTKIDEALVQPWIDYLVANSTLLKDELKPSDIVTHEFEQDF